MVGVTFEVEEDASDEASVLYREILSVLTHPLLFSAFFVICMFFWLRKPWSKFIDVKTIRDIVTDIITSDFPGVTLGVPSETRTHIHIPLVVNVEEQFFVVTMLVEEVQPYGCEVLAMSTTDYPNRRNFVLRIPLSGHKSYAKVTLLRECFAFVASLFMLCIVHYVVELIVGDARPTI